VTKLKLIYDQRSDGQSVMVSGSHLEPKTRFFLSENCGFLDVERPLWRGGGSVIYSYNCFWALPEQSLWGPSPVEHTTIYYCLIWDFHNLEGQIPVFISRRNRVAQLYPWALGFLFVASFDSHISGRGILTRLHTGSQSMWQNGNDKLIQSTQFVKMINSLHI
jgi:hypothetical protein